MSSSEMKFKTILITGGAGYVGAVLVPRLLEEGYRVKVIDLCLYGEGVLPRHPGLELIVGDIRNEQTVKDAVRGCDAVIHLACISNDPSFELNPDLGKTINFDAFEPLVRLSKEAGARRFVYASSSSVYGVSEVPEVNEDHPLKWLTDYSRFKAMCEPILLKYQADNFTTLILRPATVCGYSPRQRFDLTVNILTNHAVNKQRITVFGGTQKRPNLHIDDMADLYLQVLREPAERIAGRIFNAGYQNHTVSDIAGIAKKVVSEELPEGGEIEVVTTPSDDLRSYHISSEKIRRELGFVPRRNIEDAVRDLCRAFQGKKFDRPLENSDYYNIKKMQEVKLD